jgi:hypothetical protein
MAHWKPFFVYMFGSMSIKYFLGWNRLARWYMYIHICVPKIPIWVHTYICILWRAMQWKIFKYFMSTGYTYVFQGLVVKFMPMCYLWWSIGKLFPSFSMLNQEKSGNPGLKYVCTLNIPKLSVVQHVGCNSRPDMSLGRGGSGLNFSDLGQAQVLAWWLELYVLFKLKIGLVALKTWALIMGLKIC